MWKSAPLWKSQKVVFGFLYTLVEKSFGFRHEKEATVAASKDTSLSREDFLDHEIVDIEVVPIARVPLREEFRD